MSNEVHSKNLFRNLLHFLDTFCKLDAASFSSPTGMDLCFDHP